MKVVIDTNVIISSYMSKNSPPAQIFGKWENSELELLCSEAILEEYQSTFRYERLRQYHKLSDERIEAEIQKIRQFSRLIDVTEEAQVIRADPSDDKFLACAVAGNADYIVSGDKHLLNLGSYKESNERKS
jgi:hypothetical protein